jgi:tetratricopeptide (TPR) repeat protein
MMAVLLAIAIPARGVARAQTDSLPQAVGRLRAADAEIRAALFELVDGRAMSALNRLRRLGRVARTDATPEVRGEDDRRFLIAECYYQLGMDDSLRAIGDSLLTGPGGPRYAAVLRPQLIVSAYRTGDNERAQRLAGGPREDTVVVQVYRGTKLDQQKFKALPDLSQRGLPTVVAGLAAARRGDSVAAKEWFSRAAESGGPYAFYARTLALVTALPPDSAHAAAALVPLDMASGGGGAGANAPPPSPSANPSPVPGNRGAAPESGFDIADQVSLTLAQLAYEAGYYERAATLAASVPPGSAADPAASRTRAWALRRAGHPALALEVLTDLARRYPELPDRTDASLIAGQMALDANDVGEAVRRFAEVADTTRADAAAVAQWMSSTEPAAAAKALVQGRVANPLLVSEIALGKVLSFPDSTGGGEGALAIARTQGGTGDAGEIANALFIKPPTALAAAAVTARVDSAIAGGGAGAQPAVAHPTIVSRVVLAHEGTADSVAVRSAVARGIQALRDADVGVSGARAAVSDEREAAAQQVVLLQRERANATLAADSLNLITDRLLGVEDSLGRVSASVDAKRNRLHSLFAAQFSLTNELVTENAGLLDSVRRAARPSATPEDVAMLDREGQTIGAYTRLVETVQRGLTQALAHHPAFALRDTIRNHSVRTRAMIDETRSAIASGEAALDSALGRARRAAEDSAAPTPARAELAAATARQQAAVNDLTSAVERDLRSRAAGLNRDLQRGGEAAAFATANARFLRYVAGGDGAPAAWRDSAISDLQDVLTRYPSSAGRASALYEIGELMVRRADAEFAAGQRSGAAASIHPDYSAAIPRYEELVKKYPQYPQLDGAAYTLGTMYALNQQYADAARMFELVIGREGSPLRDEAFFRLGDARFELASSARGDERRTLFAQAADAYAHAAAAAPPGGDIYLLSLYKLGWSYYSEASPQHPDGYGKAVDVFGRLVDAYDSLPPDRQARLGLRGEALEYMAVSFTQIGGAEAANRYFASRSDTADKVQVLRRVAATLRDQGDFSGAVKAYEQLMVVAPSDTGALAAQHEVIDIYMNRTLEPGKAQEARLAFVDRFAPGFTWSSSNPQLAKEGAALREQMLREAAQYELAKAQGPPPDPAHYAEAARLYDKYLADYSNSDSARSLTTYFAEALFGAKEYAKAGAQYTRAATAYATDTANPAVRHAQQIAAQNAIVAYDSALSHATSETAAQDSLFAAVNRYADRYPESDIAKHALVEEGRRASVAGRWDVVAAAFRRYWRQYPGDPYTATAVKLVGDALYKQGHYLEAQAVWDSASTVAARTGRKGLADTLKTEQTAAASAYADSLIKAGRYQEAAQTVYVAFADKNPASPKAPDALRNAIETYMTADSVSEQKGDSAAGRAAREQAIALSNRLVTSYPQYKYRQQYQTLAADLLARTGKEAESVDALRKLIADNPLWPGRADAEIRVASRLDSLGRKADAAAQYEQFSVDYRHDPRTHDALFNAAATYLEAHDTLSAARVYGEFATRFPDEVRAGAARVYRMELLQAHGDTAAASAELARLCVSPAPELRPRCEVQAAKAKFATAVSEYHAYRPIKLVIPTRGQLTAAGVKRASVRKEQLLTALTRDFTKVIESGDPELLSAASFYVGAAQWRYGEFLRDVELPPGLTDAMRTAATQGAAQQAEAYFTQAKQTWAELIEKANSDNIRNAWVDRAHDALVNGQVPSDL